MKKRKTKLSPYVRRRRPSDKTNSIRTAIRMVYYEKGYGVFFRYIHVSKQLCVSADRTKHEMKKRLFIRRKS